MGSVLPYTSESSVPGHFTGHPNQPMMVMIEITNRCNMSCPICFADARVEHADLSLDVIEARLIKLKTIAGLIPLQISGGEPTLHPDLPAIIKRAVALGFTNIELVTNGIRISEEPDYLAHLATCGLTAVYLQFDGLSTRTYEVIRGRDMSAYRSGSLAAIRKTGLCCTLAVAVTREVNDHELGDIIRFAIANIDTVRAINFQSATRFAGRFGLAEPPAGFTIAELIDRIESQAGLESGGFSTGLLGHPCCNAMSLVFVVDGKLKPLFKYLTEERLLDYLGPNRRQTILELFHGKHRFYTKHLANPKSWKLLREAATIFGSRPSLTSVINTEHLLIFAKSFMERSELDPRRLHQCNYGIATESGVYSFCAYNNLYRFSDQLQEEI